MRIISGKHKGKLLKAPRGTITRPTSDRTKESVFNILSQHVSKWSSLHVADIFAGSGSLGIEALSRGAKNCLFIENNPQATECIKFNLASIGMLERAMFMRDCQHLDDNNHRESWDLVFMDPPYRQNLIPMALNILLRRNYLHHRTTIVVETEKDEDIPLSPEFHIQDQRVYGKAKVTFISLA